MPITAAFPNQAKLDTLQALCPAGVSVLATIGQPIASGQIQVSGVAYPAGVIGYAYVGSMIAGSVTFSSAPSGSGYSRAFTNTIRETQANTSRSPQVNTRRT